MAGIVGYDDVRAVLGSGEWFGHRTSLWNGSVDATSELVEAWVADAGPKRAGTEYTAYFFELDAWSEYWDIYKPETRGLYHFGDGSTPGYLSAFLPGPGRPRAPVFDAWKAYALSSRIPERDPAARLHFEELARQPEVTEAVLAVDLLVTGLLVEHFGDGNGGFDRDAYFDALERFALDTLPGCPERYALIPDDDGRKASSPTHQIAGDVMWFAWATHLECTELVSEEPSSARALLMAGIAFGCSMDYAFRGRGRTRAEYRSRDGAAWARIWERGRETAGDFERAAADVRELFFIRTYDD
jgi:hypothetical protein